MIDFCSPFFCRNVFTAEQNKLPAMDLFFLKLPIIVVISTSRHTLPRPVLHIFSIELQKKKVDLHGLGGLLEI